MRKSFTKIPSLKTPDDFRDYIRTLDINLPFDEQVQSGEESPLSESYTLKDGRIIGNRFCNLPMEGWDGTDDGKPTELTVRRWTNYGRSGAKLIWGGEAVAVCHEGRANPNQLMIRKHTLDALEKLRKKLVNTHEQHFGDIDDLLVGLQLTHSGRFSRPNEQNRLEPKILYHHPVLEQIYPLDPNYPVLTDGEIKVIIDDFVRASKQAYKIGFEFVDIKHCHGYLGHEFLSAHTRAGPYGGSFENRTRFLREVVSGIRSEAPNLRIGVRLSAFDSPPFRPGTDGVGHPLMSNYDANRYPFAFGVDLEDPFKVKLDEPINLLQLLQSMDIELVNISAGSPYYNPHLQRPAYYPPSDGYRPPEDPLVGVARQINTVAALKKRFPDLAITGTAYSYLQEWLPNVAQYVVRHGMTDFIGLGRMTLSYPEMPADLLAGRPLQYKKICRTFSDCTTGPRNGLVSGCYPLDEYYRSLPEAQILREIKQSKT